MKTLRHIHTVLESQSSSVCVCVCERERVCMYECVTLTVRYCQIICFSWDATLQGSYFTFLYFTFNSHVNENNTSSLDCLVYFSLQHAVWFITGQKHSYQLNVGVLFVYVFADTFLKLITSLLGSYKINSSCTSLLFKKCVRASQVKINILK